MNKAILLSIRPQWTKEIFSGNKQYEFRNRIGKDWKTGTKVYVYETFGKKKLEVITHYDGEIPFITKNYYNEGTGKVIGEFVIGEIHELKHYPKYEMVDFNNFTFYYNEETKQGKYLDLFEIGYTNQKYAIEITNVVKYDKPRELNEFVGMDDKQINHAPKSFRYCKPIS